MRIMKVFYIEEITDEDVYDVLTEFASQNDGYVFQHVKEYDYYNADDKPELIAINNGLIVLGAIPVKKC